MRQVTLAILLCCAASASNARDFSRLHFSPPKAAKHLNRAFWDTVFRLERTNPARTGQAKIVDEFKINLENLPPEEQESVKIRFLRIEHHYRGMEGDGIPADVLTFHADRLGQEINSFAVFATRPLLDQGEQSYASLFASIRSLAGSSPQGLKLSRRLASANPQNAAVQSNLAQDYLDARQFKKAVTASLLATRLDPKRSAAFITMASAHFELKNFLGAYEAADSSLRIDPGDKVAFSIMRMAKARLPKAQSFKRERSADAESTRSTARERSSKRYAEKSLEAYKRGDFQRAAEFASRSYEQNPDNTIALLRRAMANLSLERNEEALADTQAALELLGENPSPLILILQANILNHMERYTVAQKTAEKGIRIGAQSPRLKAQLLFQLAWALGGQDQRENSLKILAEAARQDSQYIPYYQEARALEPDEKLLGVFGNEELAQAWQAYLQGVRRPDSAAAQGSLTPILPANLLGYILAFLGGIIFAAISALAYTNYR